jgi:hypothetical protein
MGFLMQPQLFNKKILADKPQIFVRLDIGECTRTEKKAPILVPRRSAFCFR